MTPSESTRQSIRDGFGGDTLRRKEVSPGVYQCGCREVDALEVPKAYEMGVRGDVLILCPLHKRWNDSRSL